MYGIIYKATNLINNKCYIGQTINSLNRRRSSHLLAARKEADKLYFHKAIKKYGEDNFQWEIIDQANNKEELNEMERFYISEYSSNDPRYGYNMTSGGDAHTEQAQDFWGNDERSHIWREELKERMSTFWSDESNRLKHKNWMNDFYKTEQGIEQAKRHSDFMKNYYNGPEARKNKAKTSNWFVRAISPEGEETIYISSKEPNLFFGKDIHLRAYLHNIGDVWIPSSRASKEVQGWRFEAIEKFEL